MTTTTSLASSRSLSTVKEAGRLSSSNSVRRPLSFVRYSKFRELIWAILRRLRDHSPYRLLPWHPRATSLRPRHARLPRLLDRCPRPLLPRRLPAARRPATNPYHRRPFSSSSRRLARARPEEETTLEERMGWRAARCRAWDWADGFAQARCGRTGQRSSRPFGLSLVESETLQRR